MRVIGNKKSFAIELVPVRPSWETHYSPERAAWAGTAIWVAGNNICRHVSDGASEIEDYFYIPLGSLAAWIISSGPAITFEERASVFPTTRSLHESAERWGDVPPPEGFDEDNWLDIREGWWARHFVRAGVDGARLPDLGFVRDDEQLVITWEPPRSTEDEILMLSPAGEFGLDWFEGYSVLDRFVSQVAEWFRDARQFPFSWVHESRPLKANMPPLAVAIELFTGRPLDTLQQLYGVAGISELSRALDLPESSSDPAASAQCQMLRDLSPDISRPLVEILRALSSETAQNRPDERRKWLEARDRAHDSARAAKSTVEEGYFAADEIRKVMGLDSQPVGDAHEFLAALGIDYAHSLVRSRDDRMVTAARIDGSAAARTLTTTRTDAAWAQRFEACRAVGHLLLDPVREGTIGAASGPFAQDTRRRRSGAFAAELLLPASAIAEVSGGRLDGAASDEVFAKILERFGVGARTTAHHLWNRGWLSSPVVRDELIDRFASDMHA